jgi:hypothetical protein
MSKSKSLAALKPTKPRISVKVSAKPGPAGNLYEASTQWAKRPADERFSTIDAMRERCHLADQSRKVFNEIDIRSLAVDSNMRLQVGDVTAPMTTWSFRQICGKADVPAYFITSMPAEKASDLLQWSLANRVKEGSKARISVALGQVEAFTSERYAYIPNYRVCDGLKLLEGLGWRVPPARPAIPGQLGARKATEKDVLKKTTRGLGIQIKVGDLVAPAGLYASSKDMFAFMVHEGSFIDDGTSNDLRRGIFVSNSEVGAGAFKVTCFLYDSVCGNHIVWGASDVVTARIRHLGTTAGERAFSALEKDISAWATSDGSALTKQIRAARRTILGDSAEEIAEKLVLNKRLYAGKADALQAYELCEQLDADRVDPRSLWGIITGYTRLSQLAECADRRVHLDETAGRLMQLAAN